MSDWTIDLTRRLSRSPHRELLERQRIKLTKALMANGEVEVKYAGHVIGKIKRVPFGVAIMYQATPRFEGILSGSIERFDNEVDALIYMTFCTARVIDAEREENSE